MTPAQPLPSRGWARAYLLACCAVLVLLPLVTAPGDIIGDTKLNLAINPAGFLARAMTLWDPQQFGSLQNQATGYLFPMGPFFVLGKLAALPAWIVQRLWIAALLIAAFAGVVRLASRLGIGTPPARCVAGLAYALSPLAISMLGELSGGFIAMAMAPWVLLPLASASRGIGPGAARAAARSAVAVALCGGINATSTMGAVVPAALFILTMSRPAAMSRWRLLAWWVPAVAVATFWWTVPLLLLSKYGVSFLPYTESAATTTSVTSVSAVLRGTSDWLGYLTTNGLVWWPQAFRIATSALPTVLTGVIAGLGLSGLVRRGSPALPERRFLLCSVLAGAVVIAAGHVSSLGNPLAGSIGAFIDGPGSPFRNLWKFDPMIRLPVVLGLAHLLTGTRPARWYRAVLGTAIGAIVLLAVPAYASGLAAAGSFGQIPGYWVSAADWLNTHAGNQGVLIEPGAPFGQYLWGSPLDEVLSPLTSADYAERDQGDLGSVGEERLLDTIDEQLSDGAGSAGLTELLARMGVKYVLVRNDLDRAVLYGAWPARIAQALGESPGITRVAAFGPDAGTATTDDAVTDFDSPYPAVEIYQVAGALPVAAVQSTAGTLRVYGAPESLLTLADQNLLGSRPVLLNDDGPGLASSGSVLTDSLRRRLRNFGQLDTSYSPTLTATAPLVTFDAADDYTEPDWDRYQSVAKYIGIADVTASSSASDIGAIPGQWGTGLQPFSAVDGNPKTMWESGSWTGPVGQWIQVSFDSPVTLRGSIGAAFYVNYADWPPVSQVRVSTAAGSVTDQVTALSSAQRLRVPSGASSWLRITVTGLVSPPLTDLGAQVGISDISIPGVQAARTIVAPALPAGGDPTAVVLAKAAPQPSGCMRTSLRWVCSPSLVTPTEEQYGFDHTFSLATAEQAKLTGSAVLLSPSLVERYVRRDSGEARVTASSAYTSDPQDQALSAFDGNPATAWVSGAADTRPALSIQWGRERTVSQVRIARPPGALSWLTVLITGSGGQQRGGVVGTSGLVRFAPLRTTGLTLTFTTSQLPVQISDVTIPGVPFVRTPKGTVTLPCGDGPRISVNGTLVPTRVSGSYASLVTGQPLKFTGCAGVALPAGSNRVTEPDSDAFSVQDVVLTGAAGLGGAPAPPRAAGIVSWTASARTVRVNATVSSYLVVNENFNAGWRAVIGGRQLLAVRLDGWKQAWLLPAGTSGLVRLTYQPQSLYRIAVVGGLAGLGLIALVAVWPWALPRPRRRRWLRRRSSDEPPGEAPGEVPGEVPGEAPGEGRRFLVRVAGPAAVLAGLVAAGLWLGGYPGALILLAATVGFLICGSDLAGGAAGRLLPEAVRPRALAGLLIAASVCGAVGDDLSRAGASGLSVTAAQDAIPQVICLVVVARLAAALILS